MARTKITAVADYNSAFPERLREIAAEKRFSQERIGQEIGKARQTVSAYMDGSASPDWVTITKLSSLFGVSADWFLGLSETKTTDENVKAVCAYTGLTEEAANLLHNSFDCREYNDLYRGEEYLEILNKLITYPGFFDLLTRMLMLQEDCQSVIGYSSLLDYPDYIGEKYIELKEQTLTMGERIEYGPFLAFDIFKGTICDILKIEECKEVIKNLQAKLNNIVSSSTDVEEKE